MAKSKSSKSRKTKSKSKSRSRGAKGKSAKSPGRGHSVPRTFLRRVLILGVFACLGVLIYFYGLSLQYDLGQVAEMPQRAVIYDRDGKPYNRIYGENRTVVEYDQVSEHFIDALLAREDSRFFWHLGIDPIGVARAIVANIQAGSLKQGASTITQQLARNTFPLGGKTLHRKMLEAVVAVRIELRYSKKHILQHYMNRIYFGSGLYGIEAASLGYFGKNSSDLTISESALLAGLIRAPHTFSPLRNLDGSIQERDTVLQRMRDTGRITQQEMEEALRAEINLSDGYWLPTQNYALDYIRRELRILLDRQQRQEGGMKIKTSIDADLQETARNMLDAHLTEIESRSGWRHPKRANFQGNPDDPDSQTPYLQGAVVIIDNRTGGVRALVGGRSYYESKFNRAIQAQRQVGSIFKPFVYATAFQHGLLPHSALSDDRLRPGEIRSTNTSWSPSNSDGKYRGVQQADYGLYKSRNTMTVRAGEMAGLPHVLHVAERAGLARDHALPPYPSVYLGSFEATLRDITAAYSIFPNRGFRPKEHVIEEIIDGEEVLFRTTTTDVQVTEPYACWLTNLVLQRTFTEGTAAAAAGMGFDRFAGGKTGTTDNFVDAWFIGYTTSLTCGVWVGLDQPQRTMTGGYGSQLALPVWVEIMKTADPQKYPAEDFMLGEEPKWVSMCGVSGKLSSKACIAQNTATKYLFPNSMPLPTATCPIRNHRPAAQGYVSTQGGQPAPEDKGPLGKAFDSIKGFLGF